MKKTLALMAAVSAFAFTSAANAVEYTPYVAADYTYSDIKYGDVHGGKVAVGTEYNKYFGTEVFYQRTASDRVHSTNIDNIEDTNEFSMQSYGLDAYGYLPLGCEEVVSLVGTVGIANIDFKYKTPYETRQTENGLGYRLGAGVEYDIDENMSVRALYRYTFTDKLNTFDHLSEYSVGLKYAF